MGYELPTVYDVSIASFATSSSSIDIQRGWKFMYLKIPTMTSNVEMYVNGSDDGTTFRPIFHPMQNAVSPTGNRFMINSAVSNGMVPIPNGFRYFKVETSAVISFTAAFKIICSD